MDTRREIRTDSSAVRSNEKAPGIVEPVNTNLLQDIAKAGYLPNGALSGGNNLPPSPVKTIGDALIAKQISWAYYGGAYNDAVALSNAAVAANPAAPNSSALRSIECSRSTRASFHSAHGVRSRARFPGIESVDSRGRTSYNHERHPILKSLSLI